MCCFAEVKHFLFFLNKSFLLVTIGLMGTVGPYIDKNDAKLPLVAFFRYGTGSQKVKNLGLRR